MTNNLKKELKKLIQSSRPKITQGDARIGYQYLEYKKGDRAFEFPIKSATIATFHQST